MLVRIELVTFTYDNISFYFIYMTNEITPYYLVIINSISISIISMGSFEKYTLVFNYIAPSHIPFFVFTP